MPTTTDQGRAKRGEGLPQWDNSKQQYTQQIGYCFDGRKRRVRKAWNLGKDWHEACAQAIDHRRAWTVVAEQVWPDLRPQVERALPDYEWSKPVWLEDWMITEGRRVHGDVARRLQEAQVKAAALAQEVEEVSGGIAAKRLKSAIEVDPATIAKYLAQQGLVVVPAHLPLGSIGGSGEDVTIAKAKDRYLAAEKARVGRGGGKGIKARSYNIKFKNLHLVLGLTTAKGEPHVTGRTPIDTGRSLRSIGKADLETLVHYWMDRPPGIGSSRTAINYLNELRCFLRWCEEQEPFRFGLPVGIDRLFRFSVPKKKMALNYDPDQLRGLLNGGTEKCKLFQLLAANGGLYQQDSLVFRPRRATSR
jgi:hypothetical protein